MRAKFLVSATNMGSVSSSQESEHDARVDAADTKQQQQPLLVAPGDLSGESPDSSQLVESFASPDFPMARDLMTDSLVDSGPLADSTSSDMSRRLAA